MAKDDQKSMTTPGNDKGKMALMIVLLALAAGLFAVGVMLLLRPGTPSEDRPRSVSDAQMVLDQSRAFMKDGLYKAAIENMESYIRLQRKVKTPDGMEVTNETEVRPLLAEAYYATKAYGQAEATVDDLFRLQSLKAKMLWLKGELVRQRNEPPEKYMPFFTRAANAGDVTPETWSKYGQVLMDIGDPLAAQKWCTKAYDAGLRDAPTLRVLGELAMKGNDLPKARQLLEQAVQKDKNDPALWLMLVRTMRLQGQADKALQTAMQAVAAKEDGEILMELGQMLEAKGQKDKAANAYAAAADYRVVQAEASAAAARLLYEQGAFAKAMYYVDQAVDLSPQDANLKELQAKIEQARFGEPVKTTK